MAVAPADLGENPLEMTVPKSVLALSKCIQEYHCPGISTKRPVGRRCAADTTPMRKGQFYHGLSLALERELVRKRLEIRGGVPADFLVA
jgi:hypothetical protein